eukprot:gb/GEZN01007502.1/.p1 GENE.gb/GEZN01007502.1/~~gb/GEZN01007502.1/.p1  ORF type:complete len:178 (-),score=34.17 gb/GEZN01007502.1/:752-1285(-)
MQFERGSVIPFGKIVYLYELLTEDFNKDGEGSFRVFGRLVQYDAGEQRAILQHKVHQLEIDTKLIPDDFEFKRQCQYQFIGECTRNSSSEKKFADPILPNKAASKSEKVVMVPLLLRARVARSVEGMNLALFEKALELRRAFEQEQDLCLPMREEPSGEPTTDATTKSEPATAATLP